MNDQHPYRATIPLVQKGTSRPLWSVMIPTYNCANYLRETLKSVLAQDLGTEVMQIEVVDDCSTQDNPRAVVEEIGCGRVSFYQQSENVGYIQNFETCLKRSHGKLIHLLHGDDCVREGFYFKMQRAFDEHPEIGAAFCRHIHMDEHGHWHWISWLEQPESGILSNWLERIAVMQRIQTPSVVVRRDVYERLGGFDRRILCWGEDWEKWIQIAAHYPVWYEVQPLAIYRTRSSSLSGSSIRTGKNIQDIRRVISIAKQNLPCENADKLSQMALEHYALYALNSAKELIIAGESQAAINQIREALLCHYSLKVLYSSLKLITKLFFQVMSSRFHWQKSSTLQDKDALY